MFSFYLDEWEKRIVKTRYNNFILNFKDYDGNTYINLNTDGSTFVFKAYINCTNCDIPFHSKKNIKDIVKEIERAMGGRNREG